MKRTPLRRQLGAVAALLSLAALLGLLARMPLGAAQALAPSALPTESITPSPAPTPKDVWWSGGPYGGLVASLAVSPDLANDQTMFAGTESGIFRSTDSGASGQGVLPTTGFLGTSLQASPA